MQPVPGQVASMGEDITPGEFILPDLCAPRTVFAMVLLVELLVLVYTLSTSSLPGFNWDTLAIWSLFVQWVVLLSAAILCGLRRVLSGLSLPLVSVCCLLVVLAITALSSVLGWRLLPLFNSGSGEIWWLLRNLLVAAVLTGIAMRYFYLQHQLLVQKQLELRSRLDSLRAKIRPHFLFNTLNSIASLIASRPEEAERAVEDLSELLRVSLQENQRATLVADEQRLCELYLAIEQMRLGDRLQVVWDVDPKVREKPMPSLILQPLVENAVYHGVAQLPEGGTIRIAVEQVGELLQVTIENPVLATSSHTEGTHMALANIEQRLQGLFGDDASLATALDKECFRVVLQYPLDREP